MSITATLPQATAEVNVGQRILAEMTKRTLAFLREFLQAPVPSVLAVPPKPYRPERHYMRGPGPKWHAKYGQAGRVWD